MVFSNYINTILDGDSLHSYQRARLYIYQWLVNKKSKTIKCVTGCVTYSFPAVVLNLIRSNIQKFNNDLIEIICVTSN